MPKLLGTILPCLALAIGIGSLTTRAAVATSDGSNDGFWNDNVVAIIHSQKISSNDPGVIVVKASVVAVFSTDILIPTQLSFDCYAGAETAMPGEQSLRIKPEKDFLVLLRYNKNTNHWMLTPDFIAFMPDGCAMQVVGGVDDPKLSQLLNKVRVIRDNSRAKAVKSVGSTARP